MNRGKTSNVTLGVGFGLAAGALWGGVFIAPRILHEFTPMQLSAARYLIYGLLSALLLAGRWRAVFSQLGRAEWLALLRLSLLGNILYYVLLAAAVHLGGVAVTSLIIGLLPVTITLVGMRQEGAGAWKGLVLPLLLVLLGVGLISFDLFSREGAQDAPRAALAGVACAAGALVCWTIYAVDNARWLTRVRTISNQDWSLLTGLATGGLALGLAIPAFAVSPASHAMGDWMKLWLISGAVALGASVIGNGLWNAASRLLPLSLSGQMIVFETLFALAYGFVLEKRGPSLAEAGAIAALLTGVILCVRRRAPAATG